MTMTDDLDFYAAPGAMTMMEAADARLLTGLPATAPELCGISAGLFVHEFLATIYGVTDAAERTEELENRTAGELLDVVVRRGGMRPLAQAREPEQRVIGNCRQFSVLTCALLRRAGIPARVRAGFAAYFQPGTWTDHWIVERWDADRDRWVRTDPQLDGTQRRVFGVDFDPMDLPAGHFLPGGEAWLRCRRGDDEPERFGIQDMRGPWFVACSAVRDLAALNKVEMHVWDTWGVMEAMVLAALTDAQLAQVDHIARTADTGTLADIRRVYDADGVRVPGTVTSHRFGRTVSVGAAA